MDVMVERLRGFVLGFILAQFVSSWISVPLCVVAILVYGGSPLVRLQSMREAVAQRLVHLWLRGPEPAKAPVTDAHFFDIPVSNT